MLSPADQAVCARDPALPGLSILLDASALAATLGLHPLTPAYLRYKPGVSCTAAFLHPEAGALAAYAYPADRYAEVRCRPEWSGNASVWFLDAACIVVVPARLDRHLRALRRFLDPGRQPKYLRRVIGRREDFCKGEIELLRYKPGRRLVARIDRKGVPRAALKITGSEDFNGALIGATGAAAHGGAPLLGASGELRALVTSWVEGQAVCPQMLGHAPDPAAIAEVGAALARLHADPFRPAASIRPADDGDALIAVAEDLLPLDACLADDAKRIGAEVADRIADTAFSPTLVHGDFSADQVVIAKGRPIVLDWDHAACGDPGRDLGTFLARLDAQAADGFLTRSEADDLGAALVEGYARTAEAVPAATKLHHARALLLLASEGFRLRRANWPVRGRALIERAEAVLAEPSRSRSDPAMPEIDAALSRGRGLSAVMEVLGDDAPVLAQGPQPEVIRHKPGRRALIRYRVEGAGVAAVLGKLRAKGTDRRTPQVHRALREAGLDGLADHGVGVPRAIGQIDAMKMWLQEEVPGQTLASHLQDANTSRCEILARTGAALARLHDVPPATDRCWTLHDELDVLDRALGCATANIPESAEALRGIMRGARARLEQLGEEAVCGIHRDFYFDQVLVDGRRIWLVDLDLYSIGDPAIDLGNFLAHLDELALRRLGHVTAFAAEAAAFLDGYATVRDLPAVHRISALRSVSLARHIHISTRFQARRHTTRDLISVSLAALSEAERKAS